MHVPWVYRSNGLTRLGLYKFIVDEQSSWLLVFMAVRRCELDEEVGHVAASCVVSWEGTSV